MEMKAVLRGNRLRVALCGEFDQHCAASIRDKIDTLLENPSLRVLTIDLSEVTFMDSSGIGVILARAAQMKRRGGVTQICGATGQIERVLRLSGVYTLVERLDAPSDGGKGKCRTKTV